jgi:hypothetical protein
MRVTLENTDKIVELIIDGHAVAARIWEGHTQNGIACHAYIIRIAVHENDNAEEFDRALQEQRRATPEIAALPTRLVL